MTLRLFCAIRVPADVETKLLATIRSLQTALQPAPVSWVKAGNFHLTLSFLGDVEQERVPELASRLREACEGTGAFDLTCQHWGCFPNPNRPRVLWAGVESEGSQLSLLQKQVATASAPFAQREEKSRFHGHITLGRVRPHGNLPAGKLPREIERSQSLVFGRWSVDEVELVSSDLSQGSPRYSVVHHFPLA